MSDSPRVVEGAFVVGNLIGIPSYHFDPTFARVAANALTTFCPSMVALELPAGLIGELEWAASCWPGPVVSASKRALFPFVPGDSIFETFRFARAGRIPVVLIDLLAADPTPKPTARPERAIAIGPELSRAGARLFLEAKDSLSEFEFTRSLRRRSGGPYGGIANAASRARRESHVGWRHGPLD